MASPEAAVEEGEVAAAVPPTVMLEVREDACQDDILELFNKFDRNGDGTVNRTDLFAVLSAIDKDSWTEERIDQLLAAIDTDGDELIVFEEFLSWVFLAGKGTDYLKASFETDVGVKFEGRPSLAEWPRWMLHDRCNTDYPKTALRVNPTDEEDYLPAGAYNGEVVEIVGAEAKFVKVRLALESTEGWLKDQYLQQCPEGMPHDRSVTLCGIKRVSLKDWDGRVKGVRRFLRKRNISRRGPADEIRAEMVWFLPGHFLGEAGMATGPKETLFFGCPDSLVDCIADAGFDSVWEAICNNKAFNDFGKGAHFSKQSCRAFTLCESYMFICEVAVGCEEERLTLTVPNEALDFKQVCQEQGKLCVQCDMGSRFKHDTRVVYQPSQCKPVYLIKLETPGLYAFRGRLG